MDSPNGMVDSRLNVPGADRQLWSRSISGSIWLRVFHGGERDLSTKR